MIDVLLFAMLSAVVFLSHAPKKRARAKYRIETVAKHLRRANLPVLRLNSEYG